MFDTSLVNSSQLSDLEKNQSTSTVFDPTNAPLDLEMNPQVSSMPNPDSKIRPDAKPDDIRSAIADEVTNSLVVVMRKMSNDFTIIHKK